MLASHQEDQGRYLGNVVFHAAKLRKKSHCHALAGCQVKYPCRIVTVVAIQRFPREENPNNAPSRHVAKQSAGGTTGETA